MTRFTRIFLGYAWIILWIFFLFPLLLIYISSLMDKRIGPWPLLPKPFNFYIAILVLVPGAFWMIWSLIALIGVGRGHPVSEPGMEIQPKTTVLVTTGPYQYTRNPMIFGYWLCLIAFGIFLNSMSFALILVPVLIGFSIIYIRLVEEPWTEKRFGSDYAVYKKRTPRFIPGFK